MTTKKTVSSNSLNIMTRLGFDKTKSSDGVWLELDDEISVRVAREGNPAYREATRDSVKKYEADFDNDDKEVSLRAYALFVAETMSTALVKDWKGVKDENGKDVPYTPEIGFELFSDEGMEAVVEKIYKFSQTIENYRHEAEAKAVKN